MDQSDLKYVRDLDEMSEQRTSHSRRAKSGKEVRVVRGVYTEASRWAAADQWSRYRMRIYATGTTRRADMVLSHWSAAAIHRLPVLGDWPSAVHFTVGALPGGRSRNLIVKHAFDISEPDIVEVDGLLVTSVARTVLDMLVSADRLTATMVVDRALLIDRFHRWTPLVTRDELWAAYERRGNFRGQRRAEAFIRFGETRAESPLESVSRANMELIRCPSPTLQVSHYDFAGHIGDSDFAWLELNLVGEADGHQKYLDSTMLAGKTTAQALIDEKIREDRIRATGKKFTRWPWAVGVNPVALRAHLRRAGLPIP